MKENLSGTAACQNSILKAHLDALTQATEEYSFKSSSTCWLGEVVSPEMIMAIGLWLMVGVGSKTLTSTCGVSESPVILLRNLFVNDMNSCEELKIIFLMVKKVLMHCKMDFKQRVHMTLHEDVLDVFYWWAPYWNQVSLTQRMCMGMLPIHSTLGTIIAMAWIFKQCVMQVCTSYLSLLLPLESHLNRLHWKKPPFIQFYLSCCLVFIS